jgi:hypothetical protein
MAIERHRDDPGHSEFGVLEALAHWTTTDVSTSIGVGSNARPNVSSARRFTR